MAVMIIENAKYHAWEGENYSIEATINGGLVSIPICEGNSEYDEIMRQVEEGTITIADADPQPE
jgi:hypothetical protein